MGPPARRRSYQPRGLAPSASPVRGTCGAGRVRSRHASGGPVGDEAGRLDAKQMAEMFARAAALKATRSQDAAAGKELLSSIFARARELRLSPEGRPRGLDATQPALQARTEEIPGATPRPRR